MVKVVLLFSALLLSASFAEAAASSPKIPILLDTDIGSDIDDAFALALIVNSPELELWGVTTVSGDTQARARLAAKMLWEAGDGWRQVPVAAGEPGKAIPIEQTRWADGFTSPQLKRQNAIDFLRAEFDRHPGKITLVTIGPLCNVGALLKRYPDAAKKIKRIVMMGGSIAHGHGEDRTPAPEYNLAADPAAAQAVFASGVPILMVPLDVTAMLQLDAAARQRIFRRLTPLTNALALLYHLWNHETPTLFDPMAVAMLIDPSLCKIQQLVVEVDARGYTLVAAGKPSNATVAVHTDPAKFFQFYLSRLAP